MVDNVYVIQDNFLVYGKSTDELNQISDNILSVIENVEYRPFSAEVVGNPCFEVGDGINLKTKNQDVQSYIMSRTLKGIQGLRDDYSADGEEYRSEKVNGVQTDIIQLKGKTNTLERNVEVTRQTITDVEKNLSSRIEQTVRSIKLNINNGETTAGIVITLENEDGSTKDVSGIIELTGLVSFTDLEGDGTTVINGSNITTGTINCDLLNGGTIKGQTINGGTIDGANINAVDFTAYNDVYMQYKYGDIYGDKVKVFSMISSTTPASLYIGESIEQLGDMKVYPDTEFFNDVFIDKVLYCDNISVADLTINGHTITSSEVQLSFRNGYGGFIFIRDDGKDYLRPIVDYANVSYLGSASTPWENIYSSDGTISSSDRNLKHDLSPFSEKYEKLFTLLKPCTYIFNNKIRTHAGFVSQEVEEAMINVGLSDLEFAGFCKDKKTKETIDEKGNINIEYVYDENGEHEYIYSLRYSEFIALNTHMIQKQQKIIESQQSEIDTLKEQVSFLMQEIENLKGQ